VKMSAKRSSRTEFNRSVAKGVTLVDFNASWCQPCRKQALIIKALQKEFRKSAQVMTVNIDNHPDLALKIGIQSIPTMILYQEGKEIDRFVGLRTKQELGRALKKAIHSFSTGKHVARR